VVLYGFLFFFFSSRRRHTRYWRDWSSDVCSSDLAGAAGPQRADPAGLRLLRDPRGVRLHGARHPQGVGGPGLLQGEARPRGAAGVDRPREAERQRLVPGGWPPVRRDRRAHRRLAGQAAARGRARHARAHLDLRRRRPGRRRHPRELRGTPPVSDWYRDFANSGVGTTLVKRLGLPRPAVLRRYEPGAPLLPGPAVIGSAGEGRLLKALTEVLEDAGVTVLSAVDADGGTDGERLARSEERRVGKECRSRWSPY